MMSAGFAGSSAFLSAARPYLLAASVLFIAYGFYQGRRAKQCHRQPGVIATVLLWASGFRGDLDLLSAGDGERGG